MGYWGCHGHMYMASARDQPCGDVNQLYVSFGLDDRYDDPYGDKMLLRYIGTCHISGLINPKIY